MVHSTYFGRYVVTVSFQRKFPAPLSPSLKKSYGAMCVSGAYCSLKGNEKQDMVPETELKNVSTLYRSLKAACSKQIQ